MPSQSKNVLESEEEFTSLGPSALLEDLSSDSFREWFEERRWRQNIEEGKPYFNGPGKVQSAKRHSPSQLLQCHRKLYYRQNNAPSETAEPTGIFWFGTRFEEDLLFPFLRRTVTGANTYVQNSLWIDFEVETDSGELQIKGSTDPVIVSSDATPILPTEIKTKSSIDNISEPDQHHLAQVHAYLAGLSEQFEREYTDAVIIYGGREDLRIKPFHVTFDEKFWSEVVVDWAANHTAYRLKDELPPDTPETDWECKFCSYRVRCGQADTPHQDYGPSGLLQGYSGYPRERVIEYLDTSPGEHLTPSLAREYPDLVEEYGVANWQCESCSSEIGWDCVDPEGDPLCPKCAEDGEISSLSLIQEG